MKSDIWKSHLQAAVRAAQGAGRIMRQNWKSTKRINSETQHDIKLELDVRCQKSIERTLTRAFPGIAILGEERIIGNPQAEYRWVVDPIDGTVNFAYGIPHSCVSIALQTKNENLRTQPGPKGLRDEPFETVAAVVYDPFMDELWTATQDRPARLNGRPVGVSRRDDLRSAIVTIGFAKSKSSLNRMLPYMNRMVGRVRKLRMMGSAALALTYVAMGRFDAYVESGIRLWDVAAGGLIVERAGGEFWRRPIRKDRTYELVASNGRLRQKLRFPSL